MKLFIMVTMRWKKERDLSVFVIPDFSPLQKIITTDYVFSMSLQATLNLIQPFLHCFLLTVQAF